MRPQVGRGGSAAAVGRVILPPLALWAAAALFVSCENQDPLAPEGSTINVSADPQTVVVTPTVQEVSTITATVRGKNGTRLEKQEVVFSTSAGVLTPPAQSILISDDRGQVTSVLSTPSTATVTAHSGTISGSTTVNVVTGRVSQLTLDGDTNEIFDCGETVLLTVEALDTSGNGVNGIVISFRTLPPPTGTNTLPGRFNPNNPSTVTDANGLDGVATSTFIPSSTDCPMQCDTGVDPNAPNGGNCELHIEATALSGALVSPTFVIVDKI